MFKIVSIEKFPQGIIEKMLNESYNELHKHYPEYTEENRKNFHDCDSFFYENMEIGKNCCVITKYNGNLAGMCCWDPRRFPLVEIGHNCILPKLKGIGLGKEQLRIVLKILKYKGFEKVKVSTGLLDFFIPAQRMYKSVGFNEIKRDKVNKAGQLKLHDQIYYEMNFI